MGNARQPLLPDKIYHFYNHGVGRENIFVNEGNYYYFLKKYAEHLHGIFETYCYCLLPNHFHFLVRVRSEEEVLKILPPQSAFSGASLSDRLAHAVGSFQNAYAKAFNNQQSRKGGLFMQSFGRKEVNSADYFSRVVHYIHANAVHHGFVRNILDWKFTSYHSYLSTKSSKLNRDEVISWFGKKEDFIAFHEQMQIDEQLALSMEDFT